METTVITPKAPLVKGSSTYKIVVPCEVEKMIRFLCERVWDTEWSGVLFYTVTGAFEDGSLEVRCVDILPMDIGTTTYTEFNMSPDVISYMAENPELLDCKMGLIHSHNNMSTFFSGTDTSTLQEEGNERNHFVSLIVNNAGKYTAAITRKVTYTSTRDLQYESFNGLIHPKKQEVIRGEEIQYFYLDVEVENEQLGNKAQELSERLETIKKAKEEEKKRQELKSKVNSSSTGYTPKVYTPPAYDKYPPYDPSLYSSRQTSLFDDDDFYGGYNYGGHYGNTIKSSALSPIDDEVIDGIVTQLISGSVLVTKLDKDTKHRILNNMEAKFNSRFGNNEAGMVLFEYWAMDFMEFLVWYTIDDPNLDEGAVAMEIATKTIKALSKLPTNKYITEYIQILETYLNK